MQRGATVMLVCCLATATDVTASAAAPCTTPSEPSLHELSLRALTTAMLEPARVMSMMRRARVAAVLPHVQARVGRGQYDYTRNPDSLAPSTVATDGWRFDVSATFTLDRLVFSPYELRVAEAAGRLVEHRARLLEHIAQVWAARRALDQPHATDEPGAVSAADRCEQLTVLLIALTGYRSGFSLPDEPARP